MAKVLVPLAEDCEELEAVTVIDLLRRAGCEVITASLGDRKVRASRGTVFLADGSLDDALESSYDMIVLPGGLPGADHLAADSRIIALLQSHYHQGNIIAAICAAPRALAAAGLLENKRFTSYPGTMPDIPGASNTGKAIEWDGNIVTSRGPGTAMDFALELIVALCGKEKADTVATGLSRT